MLESKQRTRQKGPFLCAVDNPIYELYHVTYLDHSFPICTMGVAVLTPQITVSVYCVTVC